MGLLERRHGRMEWYARRLTQVVTISRCVAGMYAHPFMMASVKQRSLASVGTSSDSPSFDGGVTSIQSHATRQHYWAVGSYDESIRLFDARNPRRPVSQTKVGGGIWRAKWHPTDPALLLLGCMHEGVKVMRCEAMADDVVSDREMDTAAYFQEHTSIAYGCDWERGADAPWVYSCSFYDARLHVWRWR